MSSEDYRSSTSGPRPGDQQGYDSPYGRPPAAPKNGAGIAALILGIVAVLLCWAAGIGLLPGLLGVVFGIVGLRRARRGRATNRGTALVGLVTSLVGTVLSLIVAVLLVAVFGTAWNNGGREWLDCVRASGGSQAAVEQCTTTLDARVDDIGSVNP